MPLRALKGGKMPLNIFLQGSKQLFWPKVHRHLMFCISIIDHHLVISLQFKIDIARESRAISVFTCSDITRDRCPLYQIVNDTSKIDNGYQLFQPVFGYNTCNKQK